VSGRTLPFALLAISDRRGLVGESLPGWLAMQAAAGVGAVQLREKDLGDRARWALACSARTLLGDTRLLINGRADLARLAGAAGVHLPANEIAVEAARSVAGAGALVGRSTHGVDEVEQAVIEGADYVTFGPLFETPSKPGAHPQGVEMLARACALGVPVLAIGGVGERQLEVVARAGATGVAGIRAFQDRARLPALVARAREVFGRP
jgi:thiamine-phosphate pyrophosphorylase